MPSQHSHAMYGLPGESLSHRTHRFPMLHVCNRSFFDHFSRLATRSVTFACVSCLSGFSAVLTLPVLRAPAEKRLACLRSEERRVGAGGRCRAVQCVLKMTISVAFLSSAAWADYANAFPTLARDVWTAR